MQCNGREEDICKLAVIVEGAARRTAYACTKCFGLSGNCLHAAAPDNKMVQFYLVCLYCNDKVPD